MATVTPREIEAIWRTESRRVLATLIRLLRDFDRAEEALHDAFLAAAEQWPAQGVPANPRAWLVSAGRFKSIDRIRRKARFETIAAELSLAEEAQMPPGDRAGCADRADPARGLRPDHRGDRRSVSCQACSDCPAHRAGQEPYSRARAAL